MFASNEKNKFDAQGYQEGSDKLAQESAERNGGSDGGFFSILVVCAVIGFGIAGYELIWSFYFELVNTIELAKDHYELSAHILSIASIVLVLIALFIFFTSKLGRFLVSSLLVLLYLAFIGAMLFGAYLFIKLIVL